MGMAPVLFGPVRLPFFCLTGRRESNGPANHPQDPQVQTRAYSQAGAGTGACAWPVPRWLYNTALEQRITTWQRARISVSRFQQEAELKDIRAAMPEYAAIHSHVLQDVLARLDKTYQAFFRRVQAGEKPGFPRFQGRERWHSFTYKEYGNGARLDNGSLV